MEGDQTWRDPPFLPCSPGGRSGGTKGHGCSNNDLYFSISLHHQGLWFYLRRAIYSHQKDGEELVHVDPLCGDQFLHDVAVQTGTDNNL